MSRSQGTQFGRIPYGVVASGVVAELKPAACKVFLVLCGHVDRNWRARVGMRRIAALTGLELGSVSRAVRQLTSAGLIAVENPGNGRAFTYTIRTDRSLQRQRQPFTPAPTVQDRTVHSGATGPLAQRTTDRWRGRQQNRVNRVEQSVGAHEQSNEPPENRHEVVMTFPIRDGSQWELTRAKAEELTETFLDIDVPQCCREARQWLRNHPGRLKTASGMARYLTNWMQMERKSAAKQNGRIADEDAYIIPDDAELVAAQRDHDAFYGPGGGHENQR